ncbi:hypothetical protein ACU6VJ_03235 [Sphaerotilus sulfidivorans]|nr:hypothetical protein CQA4T8M7_31220 [Sphaerotilus natans]
MPIASTPPHTASRLRAPRLALILLLALAGPLQAAPFTPASDEEVVERLPARPGLAERRARAELQRDPSRLPLALSVAREAIDRARREGDPREYGAAQAALSPWWAQREAPAPVRLLRATILQARHEFAPALLDLQALAGDASLPAALRAQAGLTQVAVLQVQGRLAEAARACRALQAPELAAAGAGLARAAEVCAVEIDSLRGDLDPRQADLRLDALARQAPDDRWLALVRAELAVRLGDDTEAERLLSQAAGQGGDPYAQAARADWLLDRGRAAEALAAVSVGPVEADALQLRRAIALHRLGDGRAAQALSGMTARLEAARRRGEPHLREEARLALDVGVDPARAWTLAQANWAEQREPADAVLLWRSAARAGQTAQAVRLLQAWTTDPARVDVRLRAVPTDAAAGAVRRPGERT